MISSLNRVNFSTPVSVTRKLFSIPTAPTPGITNLGSKANTIFGKSSSFERGVSTGSSLICIPMPCPTNLACCSVPIKLAERPSFLAIFAAILYKSEQAVPGRVAFSTSCCIVRATCAPDMLPPSGGLRRRHGSCPSYKPYNCRPYPP